MQFDKAKFDNTYTIFFVLSLIGCYAKPPQEVMGTVTAFSLPFGSRLDQIAHCRMQCSLHGQNFFFIYQNKTYQCLDGKTNIPLGGNFNSLFPL